MDANGAIYPELAEGEKILWAGKPEKVELLDHVSRRRTLITWFICGALILMGIFIVMVLLSDSKLGQRIAMLIVLDLVPVLIIWNTVRDANALAKGTEYHITNRRVLVRTPFMAYSLSLTPGLSAEIGQENRSVRLGKAVGMKPSRERNAALTGNPRDDEGKPEGVVLINLTDPDKVLRIIRSCC